MSRLPELVTNSTLTLLWLAFCVMWAVRSLVVRHNKKYSAGKKLIASNTRYKVLSLFVYAGQVVLVPVVLWSKSPYTLSFHENVSLRFVGLVICFLGLGLSVWSLVALGKNYSPCYDSHQALSLVQSGPYRFLRHPGWLSKILVACGGILFSGSLWFVPILFWICFEMKKTIRLEEEYLQQAFADYAGYAEKTSRLIPNIY